MFILIISNKHICGLKAVHILVAVVALLCYPIVKSSNWSGGVLFISRSVHLLYPICMYLVYVLVCSKIVLYFVFGLYYFYIIPCAFVSTNHYKNYCLVDIAVFMIFYVDTCVDMSLEVSCSLAGPCIYCSIYSHPVCMFLAYIPVCSIMVLYFVSGLYYLCMIPYAFVSTDNYNIYCLVNIALCLVFYVETCVQIYVFLEVSYLSVCLFCWCHLKCSIAQS